MVKKIFSLEHVLVIFLLVSIGCASGRTSSPTVFKPTAEDQAIIDAGIKKAKNLGLRPFPLIGEGRGGKVTIISPAVVTYNRQGKWVITNEDLYINATRGDIVLEGLTIRRGQYAREVDYKLILVE